MSTPTLLVDAAVYLTAAVVAVPLSKRLGLGAVLGYLLGGVVIGPHALGLIRETESVLHFAEFGVVMLLFLIGLELEPKRLWAMRLPIFGLGSAQVAATIAVVGGAALALGVPWPVALVAGMGIAMSSTAIGLASLSERDLLATDGGQASFSVLLFQDLCVIPLMLSLTLLSPTAAGGLDALAVGKALAVIAAVVVVGRVLLRPVLRQIAATGLREVFVAMSLLLVIGVALAVSAVGLSMALGAFLAGVLLADSEYRHELELDVEPFKGLLLGLFFIAVGMSIDLGYVARQPLLVFGLAAAVVVAKLAVLWALARMFGLRGTEAGLLAVTLSQIGEFAFVLFGVARVQEILDAPTLNLLNAVTAASMLATPLAFVVFARIARGVLNKRSRAPDTIDEAQPVLVAGYGRFGQIVTRLLAAHGVRTTMIDNDPDQIDLVRRFGYKAYYGDARRIDLLEQAGLDRARLLVLALDDPRAVIAIAARVRQRCPQLAIIARARNRTDAHELLAAGVDVVRETFGSALSAGTRALETLGLPPHAAWRIARQFEAHDEQLLRATVAHRHDQQALIGFSQQGRRDLEHLLAEETRRREGDPLDAGWAVEKFPRR